MVLTFTLALIAATGLAKTWSVDGIVVAVDPVARTMLVSHRPVSDKRGATFMDAMAMPFRVADANEIKGLYPGVRIEFELAVAKDRSIARNIRRTGGPDVTIPPPKEKIAPGDVVPDFRLVGEAGDSVSLADLQGKVVAVNFIYTRCPLPDVCPRLAANFATLQRRFSARMGSDLVLLSITVDPDFDTPPVMAEYAKRWGAKSPGWRFLTGDVAPVSATLGEVYWTDEGSIGHNSTTSVIGRNGRLAATVEGSSWRVDQLEELLKHQLELPK